MSDVEVVADREPRWGVRHAIGVFLFAQVLSFIGISVFLAARGFDQMPSADDISIGETALLQTPLWTGMIGGTWLVARRVGGRLRDLGLRMRRTDVPLGLGLGVVCQFVLVPLVTYPFLVIFDVDRASVEAPARELTDKATGGGIALLVLVVVIGAPVAEEIFFRGLLQRSLRQVVGIVPTVILTAVTFGISHFQAIQLPALVAFGIVLSILVHRRGDLGMSLWTHVGFNAASVIVLLATADPVSVDPVASLVRIAGTITGTVA